MQSSCLQNRYFKQVEDDHDQNETSHPNSLVVELRKWFCVYSVRDSLFHFMKFGCRIKVTKERKHLVLGNHPGWKGSPLWNRKQPENPKKQ